MREKIVKFIDLYFIRILVNLLIFFIRKKKEYKVYNLKYYNNILILRPGGIGDAVLLFPLINYLYNKGKKIHIICMKRNKGIFDIYKKRGFIQNIYLFENLMDIFFLFKREYDVIIDTEQFYFFGSFLGKFLKKKLFIGFDTNERRYLYDIFVGYKQEEYEAQSFMNLLKVFGEQAYYKNYFNFPTNKINSKEKKLVLFVGASIKEKTVPVEYWINLIKKFSDFFEKIIFIGSSKETSLTNAIVNLLSDNIKRKVDNQVGKGNLEYTLSILSQTNYFISTDSGPLHLGKLANIKYIWGIFGPSIAEKWGGDEIFVVRNNELVCIGCNYGRFSRTPKCPYGYLCLSKLEKLPNLDI